MTARFLERHHGYFPKMRKGLPVPSWLRKCLLLLWFPLVLLFTTITLLAALGFLRDPSWGSFVTSIIVCALVGMPMVREWRKLPFVLRDLRWSSRPDGCLDASTEQ